jgi:subtilisin family serine protease
MKNTFIILLAFAVLALAWADALGADRGKARYAPGEILVKFKQGSDESKKKAAHKAKGAKRLNKLGRSGLEHVRLPKGMSVERAVRLYSSDPDVEFAEPNLLRRASSIGNPDDPGFASQWNLPQIQAPEAWAISTGNASIVVAVIDSGVDTSHPDLSGNIWSNPGETCGDGSDNDGNGYEDDCMGWDFVDNDGNPEDLLWHGTFVAGIIGAMTNNSAGMAGGIWNVSIMPLRFLDSTAWGTTGDEIAAIYYALYNGAKYINASFGASGAANYSLSERFAISEFCDSGGIFVASAGNGFDNNSIGKNNDGVPDYPASYNEPCIISVAASDSTDQLASFSNYGRSVDLAAPGANVSSIMPSSIAVQNVVEFDTLPGSWTTGLNSGTNTWGISSTGCRDSGDYCLQDSTGGAFFTGGIDTWITTHGYDLSQLGGLTNCRAHFLTRYETGLTDSIEVWASNSSGGTYTELTAYNGTSSGKFISNSLDVSAFDGGALYLRFRIRTANDGVYHDGVYIDNLQVRCDRPSAYYFFTSNGTSYAAPLVTAAAGLLNAASPTLPPLEIRARVINSAEFAPALVGLTATDGRLNAFNAMLPVPKIANSTLLSGGSALEIRWTDVDGESGYVIERLTSSASYYQALTYPAINATSYIDNGISPGGLYRYRVRSASGSNLSAFERTVSVGSAGGSGDSGDGVACFIATAAWGSPDAPEVKTLREFRDRALLKSRAGRSLVAFYYRTSPPVAEFISERPALRLAVRAVLGPTAYALAHLLAGGAGLGLIAGFVLIYRKRFYIR